MCAISIKFFLDFQLGCYWSKKQAQGENEQILGKNLHNNIQMICLIYFPCLGHFVPTPRTGRSVCPFLVIPSADQAVLASAKIGGNCLSQGQPAGIFLDQKGLSSLGER